MLQELIQLGLTKNQAMVYLTLIKQPEQSAGAIAKETKIDRSFVYGILESLVKKGLVSSIIKENTQYYFATKGDAFLKNIEEKRAIATAVLKKLSSLYLKKQIQRSVKVYDGKEGIKVLARSVLNSKEFCLLAGGGGEATLHLLQYESPHYLKEANKKKLKGRMLLSDTKRLLIKKLPLFPTIQIHSLAKPKARASFVIFGDTVAIYSLQQKPIVVMIQEKNMAQALQLYFEILWAISKK